MLLKEDKLRLKERMERGGMMEISHMSGKSPNPVYRWFQHFIKDSPEIERAALEYFNAILEKKRETNRIVSKLIKGHDTLGADDDLAHVQQ
jgi:hypothetical protein